MSAAASPYGSVARLSYLYLHPRDHHRATRTDTHLIVFLERGPLYLVCVSATGEHESCLVVRAHPPARSPLCAPPAASIAAVVLAALDVMLHQPLPITDNLIVPLAEAGSCTPSLSPRTEPAFAPPRPAHRDPDDGRREGAHKEPKVRHAPPARRHGRRLRVSDSLLHLGAGPTRRDIAPAEWMMRRRRLRLS